MTYRDRREAKAERLRGWADSREAKAGAAFAKSDAIAGMIPFGQPILVGHHSERRHRADIARMGAGMDAGIAHARKADDMRRRADGIDAAAAHAIYSDDPDAVERLAEKLARLEAERDRFKRYNATARKGAPDPSILDDKQRRDLAAVERYSPHRTVAGAIPAYMLSNLSGTIKRTRDRLAKLTPKETTT
ncbi:MAG: DUF3560 domain-containing protein [Acidimicrobiales bacterium]